MFSCGGDFVSLEWEILRLFGVLFVFRSSCYVFRFFVGPSGNICHHPLFEVLLYFLCFRLCSLLVQRSHLV